ncbi:MAG: hypothetical protein AB7F53_06325, partial [Nitrososphaeraceae archaeon]
MSGLLEISKHFANCDYKLPFLPFFYLLGQIFYLLIYLIFLLPKIIPTTAKDPIIIPTTTIVATNANGSLNIIINMEYTRIINPMSANNPIT